MNFAELRGMEFPQLGETVYADWTGGALPPRSLIEKFSQHMGNHLLGNPHSHHGPAMRAMADIEETRAAILRFLHASPNEYDVIFTANASSAILLLRYFNFENGEFLYTADNHNSVVGLREIARSQGGKTGFAPLLPNLTFDDEALLNSLRHPTSRGFRLFAFPAKSNYTGRKHPLQWIETARKNGWFILLDAAAFLANDYQLDLSSIKPDFVPISFYKMFGFPTGVGCLLVRKAAYTALRKHCFSGGTISFASVERDTFALESGHAGFEDGTLNFQLIPAVKRGLEFLEKLGDRSFHSGVLGARLHKALSNMTEGEKSVCLLSPHGSDVVTWGIKRDDGFMNTETIERAAREQGIALRTGCFCNPGVNEEVFGYQSPKNGKPIGAIRASFGYANNENDADRVAEFMRDYLRTL